MDAVQRGCDPSCVPSKAAQQVELGEAAESGPAQNKIFCGEAVGRSHIDDAKTICFVLSPAVRALL